MNRNLITRMGLASGLVAAAVATVFLVMIVAIRDQRDATRQLGRAQVVISAASVLETRISEAATQEAVAAGQQALRDAVAGEPDQVIRNQRLDAALAVGRQQQAVELLNQIVVLEAARSARTRKAADDSASRAILLGILGLIGSTLLIGGLTVYLANAIVVPLRRTTRAARQIAAGDLTVRVKEEGDAEPREMARAFNRMAANLQESERQKDEFFALVSHELRTPLTSIIGYLELVLDDPHLTEDGRRFLEIVERNARRLLRLVGDMLFIAQVEAGRMSLEREPVDLLEIAHEAVDAAQPSAQRRGVHLTLEGDAAGPAEGDPERLGQMVDNLISNALKFTPEGKGITVHVHDGGDAAELTVTDEGAGIPAEDLDRLFERFYRSASATRRAVPGVGLGLSIVKTIVDGHGGEIRLASTEGEGTTVMVRLPHPAAPPAAGELPPAAGNDPGTDPDPDPQESPS